MAEYRIRLLAFNAATVIAVGIVVSIVTSTIVASNAYRSKSADAAKVEKSIVVKGKATQRIRSDQGNWSITVNGTGETIQKAHAILTSGMGKVALFLQEHGFAENEIHHGSISTRVYYQKDAEGNQTRTVIEYELWQRIRVETSNVDNVADAAGKVTDLLKDGIFVSGGIPSYTYSKAGSVKVQILADAAADAKTRATEVAEKTGSRVTEVKDIRQGVIQITSPNSTRVTSYGVYDTSTIMKDISVVVTVEFGIGGG